MTAGLSLGHWLLCVAVEPPLPAGEEAEPGQAGGGNMAFCTETEWEWGEAAVEGTASARPPIPGRCASSPDK